MIDIIYSYYNQYNTLSTQVQLLNSYSKETKNTVNLIYVDDNSTQTAKQYLEKLKLTYSLYYITENVGWNNGGAKNLGIYNSKSDWKVVLDIDMFLTDNLLQEIFLYPKKENCVYKFLTNKIESTKPTIYKTYPGALMIHKNAVEKIGYFDEDFCGNYGCEDKAYFAKARHYNFKTVKLRTENKLIFLDGLPRKKSPEPINVKLFDSKNKNKEWSTDILRFKWKKII